MPTQEPLFFSDTGPFDAIQHTVLLQLIDNQGETSFPRRLRTRSAASRRGMFCDDDLLTTGKKIVFYGAGKHAREFARRHCLERQCDPASRLCS